MSLKKYQMEKNNPKSGIQLLVLVFLSLLLFSPHARVAAQDETPPRPVYIVQEGDSLWSVAARFRVSLDDLTALNNISDPNQVSAGTQLMIPGLDGMQGELVTRTIGFGENMRSPQPAL